MDSSIGLNVRVVGDLMQGVEVVEQNSSRETYSRYGFDTDLHVFPCEKALLWKILVSKGLGPLGDTPAQACRKAEA